MRIFALLLCLSCGGLNLDQARKSGFFDPEKWFVGSRIGYGVAADRNGNPVATFSIERECTLLATNHGECLDKQAGFVGAATQKVIYNLDYMDNLDVEVSLKQSAEESVKGLVYGNQMFLTGQQRIIGSEKVARVEVHFQRLSGPGEPVLQKETYRYLGLLAGQVEIFWLNR
ncbi:MAG: hypothetical protein HS115_09920 [Spirochaetales bacterium]|nr:hypothetical protein [Spirochaetales bacterium]